MREDKYSKQNANRNTRNPQTEERNTPNIPFTSSFSQGPSPEEHLLKGYAFCLEKALEEVTEQNNIDFIVGGKLEIFKNTRTQYKLMVNLSVEFPKLNKRDSEKMLDKALAVCVYPSAGEMVEVSSRVK